MSHCHGSKISGSPESVVLQIWQEKIKGMTFLWMVALRNKTVVHIFLPSIEKAMAVSVKKDC